MEDEKIMVLDEFGNEREANVLNVVEIDDQEFLLYTIEEDQENDGVYAMKIVKNGNDEDLVPITDINEKEILKDVINELTKDL